MGAVVSRNNLPDVPLTPTIYDLWLRETPKEVISPDILTEEMPPLPSGLFVLRARTFRSQVLPSKYADHLILLGSSSEFEGFEIWATVEGYDYLLRGECQHLGEFETADHRTFKNHPHFHEVDYYHLGRNNKLCTRRQVPPTVPPLIPGITPQAFVEAFTGHYRFKAVGAGGLAPSRGGNPSPTSKNPRQMLLHEVRPDRKDGGG